MTRLDDSRLDSIERSAREDPYTLQDRVTIELVHEIRHHRQLLDEHGIDWDAPRAPQYIQPRSTRQPPRRRV